LELHKIRVFLPVESLTVQGRHCTMKIVYLLITIIINTIITVIYKEEFCSGSSEAFMALVFQIEVFWFVTPCSVVVGYQRFRGPYCHHLQDEVG
jgi:hypothetical protein